MKTQADGFWPHQFYADTHTALRLITKCILFEFSQKKCQTKDIIIRNFVARSDVMISSIFALYAEEDYQDCWILYRCLLDRFFHMSHLNKQNQYEVFEAWSFYEQCKALNRAHSDQELNNAVKKTEMFSIPLKDKSRWKSLEKYPPVWRRPKAEDVAKEIGMDFLYRFGYDYASTHVHPMANDGDIDFHNITGIKTKTKLKEPPIVLSNAMLIGSMILQEALNSSTNAWRKIVYDSVSDIRKSLDTGQSEYEASFNKVTQLAAGNMQLSGPRSPQKG